MGNAQHAEEPACWPSSGVAISRQCRRRGESDEAVEAARNVLSQNVLTIGFARRFATYKRANLLFDRRGSTGAAC